MPQEKHCLPLPRTSPRYSACREPAPSPLALNEVSGHSVIWEWQSSIVFKTSEISHQVPKSAYCCPPLEGISVPQAVTRWCQACDYCDRAWRGSAYGKQAVAIIAARSKRRQAAELSDPPAPTVGPCRPQTPPHIALLCFFPLHTCSVQEQPYCQHFQQEPTSHWEIAGWAQGMLRGLL